MWWERAPPTARPSNAGEVHQDAQQEEGGKRMGSRKGPNEGQEAIPPAKGLELKATFLSRP